MKKADIIGCIEDGEELAFASYVPKDGLPSSGVRRVLAISVGAPREQNVGTYWRSTKTTNDGVEVEFLDEPSGWGLASQKKLGERDVVKGRQLFMTWAQYEAEGKRIEDERSAALSADEQARDRAEAARAKLGMGRVDGSRGRYQIIVSVEEAEAS